MTACHICKMLKLKTKEDEREKRDGIEKDSWQCSLVKITWNADKRQKKEDKNDGVDKKERVRNDK